MVSLVGNVTALAYNIIETLEREWWVPVGAAEGQKEAETSSGKTEVGLSYFIIRGN